MKKLGICLIAAGAALMLMAVLATPANAGMAQETKTLRVLCAPEVGELLSQLETGFNEVIVGGGKDQNSFAYILTMAPGGGSFSWIAVHPETQEACIFFVGDMFKIRFPEGFEEMGNKPLGDPA